MILLPSSCFLCNSLTSIGLTSIYLFLRFAAQRKRAFKHWNGLLYRAGDVLWIAEKNFKTSSIRVSSSVVLWLLAKNRENYIS